MKTFFIDNSNLSIGDIVELNEVEHNHLSRVLRLPVGEQIEVFNNTDFSYICKITSITKKQTQVQVINKIKASTNPKSNVTVFTALLKGDKFEFLITKFTELGVSSLIPFESEFCMGKASYKKDRYLQIAKDACKQCKRTKLLQVKQCLTFSQMLVELKNYDKVIFAYEKEGENSLSNELKNLKSNQKIALIIGSEGGFSEKEAQSIIDCGAKCVSLGNRILRAETANIMLASIVLQNLGEFEAKNC